MATMLDLRAFLAGWPYTAKDEVRRARGADGREIILVRKSMGLEQYEVDGPPDGLWVRGMPSLFDCHRARIAAAEQNPRADSRELGAAECEQLIDEAIAYHRRMLFLFRLKDWARVERDSERNLRLIAFIQRHARCAEDRVQLDSWHPKIARVGTVARAFALLEKGRDDDLLKSACDALGLGAGLDEIPSRMQLAVALRASAEDCLTDPSLQPPDPASLFQKQDDYWIIVYRGHRTLLKSSRGLHCLAILLRHPEREFHVTELLSRAWEGGTSTGSKGEKFYVGETGHEWFTGGLFQGSALLDAQAKAQYRTRLQNLREEISEAEQRNDSHRLTRAREEMNAITQQLASAIGLGGRDRQASSEAERARCAATKRIKDSIHRISEAIPVLGHHFAARIKTGYFCSYRPHPERRVQWQF